MVYTPAPPTLADVVAETLDAHSRQLGGRYSSEHYTQTEIVGRFTTVGEATVETQLLVKFERELLGERRRSVSVGAAAQCRGFGCTEPRSDKAFAAAVPLDTDRHDVAIAVTPLVQAAREWAQSHAERCRAQTYTGQ
jgi:hypothetical protein